MNALHRNTPTGSPSLHRREWIKWTGLASCGALAGHVQVVYAKGAGCDTDRQ